MKQPSDLDDDEDTDIEGDKSAPEPPTGSSGFVSQQTTDQSSASTPQPIAGQAAAIKEETSQPSLVQENITPPSAAEMLASSTVESALNAAVKTVLEATITNSSNADHDDLSMDVTDESSPVSADSASGLVYVDQVVDIKTDTQKSQAEANASNSTTNMEIDNDITQYL